MVVSCGFKGINWEFGIKYQKPGSAGDIQWDTLGQPQHIGDKTSMKVSRFIRNEMLYMDVMGQLYNIMCYQFVIDSSMKVYKSFALPEMSSNFHTEKVSIKCICVMDYFYIGTPKK